MDGHGEREMLEWMSRKSDPMQCAVCATATRCWTRFRKCTSPVCLNTLPRLVLPPQQKSGGLLEIINDLPIGFPINNVISQVGYGRTWRECRDVRTATCTGKPYARDRA